ncbi:EsaB/YukD family protein [Cellulomonas sp. Y8]|uniref:EsaB/YukD family protein n=1 Tax=Cellulomonas sp. Y8 TaxID=2591145 RepID=UPI00143E04ED|nr:EsaB/YukD family protein [Cellulomonas sp. Y8]
MASHVDVTLTAGEWRADLRVPTRVTVHRLVGELAAIFPGLDAGLPKYQLQVLAKGLLLTEEDVLAAHPVTDGDVVELIRRYG